MSYKIKWNRFEIHTGLDLSRDYRQMVTRAVYVASRNPGLSCTDWTGAFFTTSSRVKLNANDTEEAKLKTLRNFNAGIQTHYKNLIPGRILIGPGDGMSYTHEAVAVKDRRTDKIVAVFDPIRNAPMGQKNTSVSSANDRFSLAEWLTYKTRFHHGLKDIYQREVEGKNMPFCVFVLDYYYPLKNFDQCKIIKRTMDIADLKN